MAFKIKSYYLRQDCQFKCLSKPHRGLAVCRTKPVPSFLNFLRHWVSVWPRELNLQLPALQSSAPLTELILLASKQGNLRQTVADQGGPDQPTPKRNTSDQSSNCRCPILKLLKKKKIVPKSLKAHCFTLRQFGTEMGNQAAYILPSFGQCSPQVFKARQATWLNSLENRCLLAQNQRFIWLDAYVDI